MAAARRPWSAFADTTDWFPRPNRTMLGPHVEHRRIATGSRFGREQSVGQAAQGSAALGRRAGHTRERRRDRGDIPGQAQRSQALPRCVGRRARRRPQLYRAIALRTHALSRHGAQRGTQLARDSRVLGHAQRQARRSHHRSHRPGLQRVSRREGRLVRLLRRLRLRGGHVGPPAPTRGLVMSRRHSPVVPSSSSRRTSRWPRWRAVSSIMCTYT